MRLKLSSSSPFVTFLAILLGLALFAAACGSDDDDSGDTATEDAPAEEPAAEEPAAEEPAAEEPAAEEPAAEEPAAEEPAADEGPTAIRVTSLNLCNESYMYWGIDKGLFADAGLEVELIRTAGGAAGVAAIVSGAADFSFTNGFTTINTYVQGFPVNYVSNAYEIALPPKENTNAVAVLADSDITGPADLVGKKLAVNELAGVNQIVVSAWLEANGVDFRDVNFVALPFPQLVPAVLEGTVDAAQVPASLANSNPEEIRSLGDPYVEGVGNIEFAGYLVTDDFLAENEATAMTFHEVMNAAVAAVEDPANFDEVQEISASYCGQDAEILKNSPQNEFEAKVDMDLFNKMSETLVAQGYLREVPDLEGMVPEFARK